MFNKKEFKRFTKNKFSNKYIITRISSRYHILKQFQFMKYDNFFIFFEFVVNIVNIFC